MITQHNYTIATQKEKYPVRDWTSFRLRKYLSKAVFMTKIDLRILSAGKLALNKLVSIWILKTEIIVPISFVDSWQGTLKTLVSSMYGLLY